MSKANGRRQTLRRRKNSPAEEKKEQSLDNLPTGQPLARPDGPSPVTPEAPQRPRVNSEALLDELRNITPDELAQLLDTDAPRRFRPGDKVRGTVVRISTSTAFVDIGAKAEASLNMDGMDQQLSIGAEIEAFVLRADGGGIVISQQLGGQDADLDTLFEAMEANVPVEGRVTNHNAGGFSVRVGQVAAFCPRSQMDRFVHDQPEQYVQQTYSFQIVDIEGSKVVLSRKAILEAELKERAAALWERITPGDTHQGIVVNIRDFGVFVDIDGVQGLVSSRELSWDADEKPKLIRGQTVSVRVLDVDRGRNRLSLSMRDPAFSPWSQAQSTLNVGEIHTATVSRLTDFGAFLQVLPGVDGLCHISNIAKRRIAHPSDVLQVGTDVKVRILSMDTDKQRLDLGIRQVDEDWKPTPTEAPMPRPANVGSLGTMADLFAGLTLDSPSAKSTKRSKKSKK